MPAKKRKKAASAASTKTAKKSKSTTKAPLATASTAITIEACKSWGVFKRSSAKLISLLGENKCVINPGWDDKQRGDKIPESRPGKGNFIVSVGTKKIIELKSMARPFKKLRTLDFETAAKKILLALK